MLIDFEAQLVPYISLKKDDDASLKNIILVPHKS